MKYSIGKKVHHIPVTISFFLVFFVGTVFLTLFLTIFKKGIPEGYSPVEATIEKIDSYEDYDSFGHKVWFNDVYISYESKGDTYTNIKYTKYNSSMEVGDTVTIYVNDLDSTDWVADDSDAYIFPLICGVFAIAGLVGFAYNIKQLVDLKKEASNNG